MLGRTLSKAPKICCIWSNMKSMSTAAVGREGAIDVHTHMYLPKYMDILRKRSDVPYVRDIAGTWMF